MLKTRSIQTACLSCRLHSAISSARIARLPCQTQVALQRAQTPAPSPWTQRRFMSATARRNQAGSDAEQEDAPSPAVQQLNIEVNARRARERFRDALPRGYLTEAEYKVYERLFGRPVFVDTVEELLEPVEEEEEEEEEIIAQEREDGSMVLLRKGEDGELEEIELVDEAEDPGDLEATADGEEADSKSKTPEEWEIYREEQAQKYHDAVYEQTRFAHVVAEDVEKADEMEDEDFIRAHPLTLAGRFELSPSTVFLPETLVAPTALLLTRANHKHLAETSNRIFGGRNLPFSASTPPARLAAPQKPIPLDPSQPDMGHIEADAYMASVQPGTYASVMSALVEVRRRLGTPWIERILQKEGGTILDAGSGGVGVLAWHEILRAEWQRMHDKSGNTSHGDVPLGKATVLAASDTLRHRASRLLDNTTFIPRLPENIRPEDVSNEQQPRKVYDIIIAPHTLWPLRQEYLRKEQVQKYWSLLNPKGGVLILLEKGLPRGFEIIAAARELLLNKHISSPDSPHIETPLEAQIGKPDEDTRFTAKETGMIIAPCTNHSTCPMYLAPGISAGRKDFCFFSQRYTRPPYLQRILDAKDRNHEDVQFSYIAVQRGRDQRTPQHDLLGTGFAQNPETTDAAFQGHEWKNISEQATANGQIQIDADLKTPQDVNPLTLPRLILPPLKRRGHIILDLCTPSATLERWTVPRSFSKQAFRDARKAHWGDLWALGAKTRIPRNVRLGRPTDEFDKKGRRMKRAKRVVVEIGVGERNGKIVEEGEPRILRGDRDGRYSSDRKIRGSGGRKGRKNNKTMVDDILDDM